MPIVFVITKLVDYQQFDGLLSLTCYLYFFSTCKGTAYTRRNASFSSRNARFFVTAHKRRLDLASVFPQKQGRCKNKSTYKDRTA